MAFGMKMDDFGFGGDQKPGIKPMQQVTQGGGPGGDPGAPPPGSLPVLDPSPQTQVASPPGQVNGPQGPGGPEGGQPSFQEFLAKLAGGMTEGKILGAVEDKTRVMENRMGNDLAGQLGNPGGMMGKIIKQLFSGV